MQSSERHSEYAEAAAGSAPDQRPEINIHDKDYVNLRMEAQNADTEPQSTQITAKPIGSTIKIDTDRTGSSGYSSDDLAVTSESSRQPNDVLSERIRHNDKGDPELSTREGRPDSVAKRFPVLQADEIRIRDYAYDPSHLLFKGLQEEYLEQISSDSDVHSPLYSHSDYQYHKRSSEQQTKGESSLSASKCKEALSNSWAEDAPERVSDEDICGMAVALYDFSPEHSNEFPLKRGDVIWIAYRYGDGWLVAQDTEDTSRIGLVPEDYCEMIQESQSHEKHQRDIERDVVGKGTKNLTSTSSDNPIGSTAELHGDCATANDNSDATVQKTEAEPKSETVTKAKLDTELKAEAETVPKARSRFPNLKDSAEVRSESDTEKCCAANDDDTITEKISGLIDESAYMTLTPLKITEGNDSN